MALTNRVPMHIYSSSSKISRLDTLLSHLEIPWVATRKTFGLPLALNERIKGWQVLANAAEAAAEVKDIH